MAVGPVAGRVLGIRLLGIHDTAIIHYMFSIYLSRAGTDAPLSG